MRIPWLVLIAAGCDAGSPAPPLAEVVVLDGDAPVAGAPVVFHDAAGHVTGLVATDERGVAAHPLEPGGLITVAHPAKITLATSRLQLITHVGARPGERLTVEIPDAGAAYQPGDPGPVVGSIDLEIPPMGGAGFFVVHLGCADVMIEELEAAVDVPERCLGADGRVSLTVEAFTPPDLPAPLGTTFAAGVELSSRVALPAWAETAPVDVAIAATPDRATEASATLVMLAGGLAFEPVMFDSAPLAGEPVTLSPGVFPGFADAIDLEVRLFGAGAVTEWLRLDAPLESVVSVSEGALLPMIGGVAVDPGADSLSWQPTGDTGFADATLLSLRSERAEGAVRRTRRWLVVAPPGIPSPFALPELPAELADWRPLPGDEYLEPGVVTFDVSWIAGYDAFLADHGAGFLDEPCVPAVSEARMTWSGAFHGPRLTRP